MQTAKQLDNECRSKNAHIHKFTTRITSDSFYSSIYYIFMLYMSVRVFLSLSPALYF